MLNSFELIISCLFIIVTIIYHERKLKLVKNADVLSRVIFFYSLIIIVYSLLYQLSICSYDLFFLFQFFLAGALFALIVKNYFKL